MIFLRNVDAGPLFETFMVSAVAAILTIRVFLHVTGYPQIGGDTLHIAHMLWGGLLMAVSVVFLLGWLGAAVRNLAAAVGGLGFGTFIDEIGKFVTADNDYFYRPAFALIYLTFILLWLAFRATQRPLLSPVERAANALELAQEAVRHDLDDDEKRRALELLAAAPPDDPVVRAVHSALERIAASRSHRPGFFSRARQGARDLYARVVRHRGFTRGVISIAVLLAGVALGQTVLTALRLEGAGLTAPEWAELIARAVPACIMLAGAWQLPRSRLAAYRTFHGALLFQIFITRVITFYVAQLGAALALLADIIVLSTVRTLIQQEESLARDLRAKSP